MRIKQFEFARLEYNESTNILIYRVKQGIVVDVHEISEMLKYVEEFMGYVHHYAVIDFGDNLLSTTEARKAYALSSYIQKYRIADAFLVKSLAVRLVANFFINVTKPKIRTKLFTSEAQALQWLENIEKALPAQQKVD